MAATTLARAVLHRVSVQLGDVNPQFLRWTEQELVNWLNDGQRLIAALVPASCSRTDAIKLSAGTKQSIDLVPAASIVPGDGSAAVDTSGTALVHVVRNMGAAGLTPGRAIRAVERQALDALSPKWHAATGSEILEYVYDSNQPKVFYVYPGVGATASMWVEINWLVSPAVVPYVADSLLLDGPSTQKLSIDDMYVEPLVEYILSKAWLKFTRTNTDDANRHAQMAAASAALFSNILGATAGARLQANAGADRAER